MLLKQNSLELALSPCKPKSCLQEIYLLICKLLNQSVLCITKKGAYPPCSGVKSLFWKENSQEEKNITNMLLVTTIPLKVNVENNFS